MVYESQEWKDAVHLISKTTGLSITTCGEALYATLGDIEFAIEYLKYQIIRNPSRY